MNANNSGDSGIWIVTIHDRAPQPHPGAQEVLHGRPGRGGEELLPRLN